MELLGLVLEEPRWVVTPVVMVGPDAVHILFGHKLGNFMIRRIRPRLRLAGGHVLLEVRVDDVVAELAEHLHLALGPLIEVDAFDLGNMHTQLTVHAYVSELEMERKYLPLHRMQMKMPNVIEAQRGIFDSQSAQVALSLRLSSCSKTMAY